MQFALLIYESPEAFAARHADENDPYLGAWRVRRWQSTATPGDRDYGATEGWKAARTRWPLRGCQGATRGIHNPGASVA
jgi:hypothetical protein